MPKVVRIALLLTGILVLAAHCATAPAPQRNASVEATDAKWIADLYGSNYPEAPLQIATAEATELRTWPGTQFNYQKAYADWLDSTSRLDADIAGRHFSAYRWHVAQLVFRRRVDVADAARLIRLSFRAR